MYYLATLLVAAFSGLCVFAQTTTTLAYDTTYDDGSRSLDQVACSNGPNGLETKYPGATTLGSLPGFPNVGGVYTVEGWGSKQCGACYAVTYEGTTVNILAVDKSQTGFTVSKEAMDTLTGGHAVELGRVDVSFVPVSASECSSS